MTVVSYKLWMNLQHLDESQPLYRHLWFIHYRRSLWASSSAYGHSMTSMVVTILLSPVFILAPLAVSPLFATYWAVLVAGMIRYEHQQNRFDLMAILPGGSYGAYRTIASLHVRRSRLYHHLHDALNVTALVGGIFVFLLLSGLIVGMASATMSDPNDLISILTFTIDVALVLSALYVDQIQSAILGIHVGMFVPLFTKSTFEARMWAASAYISIQVILYSVAASVGFWILPMFISDNSLQPTLSIILSLFLLFVLRETTLRRLLAYLTDSLGKPA